MAKRDDAIPCILEHLGIWLVNARPLSLIMNKRTTSTTPIPITLERPISTPDDA